MLAVTLSAYAVEQVLQVRYGLAGVVALALVTIGHRIRSTMFTAIGLTALALLLAQ